MNIYENDVSRFEVHIVLLCFDFVCVCILMLCEKRNVSFSQLFSIFLKVMLFEPVSVHYCTSKCDQCYFNQYLLAYLLVLYMYDLNQIRRAHIF